MFKPKDQIAYIPTHAKGKAGHPDVEFGFVFSSKGESSFCRFWLKGQPGILRTISCSEIVSNNNLVDYNSVSQGFVSVIYEEIINAAKNL